MPEEEVFTVYIKELGPWTKALRLVSDGPAATASPQSLLVDVDGFYNTAESFKSMMAGGTSRIVMIAGGSGITSLMGFIQVGAGWRHMYDILTRAHMVIDANCRTR